MSLMGFQKKNIWIGAWVGGLSSIQFFLDFWNFFNFAKLLSRPMRRPYFSGSVVSTIGVIGLESP